jgi:hypothetical protein
MSSAFDLYFCTPLDASPYTTHRPHPGPSNMQRKEPPGRELCGGLCFRLPNPEGTRCTAPTGARQAPTSQHCAPRGHVRKGSRGIVAGQAEDAVCLSPKPSSHALVHIVYRLVSFISTLFGGKRPPHNGVRSDVCVLLNRHIRASPACAHPLSPSGWPGSAPTPPRAGCP